MTRIVRFLVVLGGLAGLLLSAGGLLVGVGLGGPGALLTDLWMLVVTLFLAVVGVWGTISARTWGPMLLATSSGAWAILAALNIAPWAAAAFALAAALSGFEAARLWRLRSPGV